MAVTGKPDEDDEVRDGCGISKPRDTKLGSGGVPNDFPLLQGALKRANQVAVSLLQMRNAIGIGRERRPS
jgi:hypothetical protein